MVQEPRRERQPLGSSPQSGTYKTQESEFNVTNKTLDAFSNFIGKNAGRLEVMRENPSIVHDMTSDIERLKEQIKDPKVRHVIDQMLHYLKPREYSLKEPIIHIYEYTQSERSQQPPAPRQEPRPEPRQESARPEPRQEPRPEPRPEPRQESARPEPRQEPQPQEMGREGPQRQQEPSPNQRPQQAAGGDGSSRSLPGQAGGNPPPPTQSRPADRPLPGLASKGAGGASALPELAAASARAAVSSTGAQPFREMGIPREHKAYIYQQVILASMFFRSEGGEKAGAGSATFFQTTVFLKQCKSLDQDVAKLWVQLDQMTAGGKTPSAEQKNAMTAAMNTLLQQFEALQKQAKDTFPQLMLGKEGEPLPENLRDAVPMLKVKCDLLLSQLQGQLNDRLTKMADQINLKAAASVAAEAAQAGTAAEKGAAAKAATGAALSSEASTAEAATLSQAGKGAKAMTTTPAAAAADSIAQAGVEAKSSTKPTAPLPQMIQSSADLHTLADKLQKKELAAPFNIALIYPLDKKEMSQSNVGVKTDSKEKKQEQSQVVSAAGGGHKQEMVLIPAGPAIVEGPFFKEGQSHPQVIELPDYLIAVSPVTNEQFADWLNESFDAHHIKLDEKGVVYDQHRNILCRTHWASSTSQIEVEVTKGQLVFKPLKGTDAHPVVQVSWLGAKTYCRDNHFRLPTEAEWEKAAGMPILREEEALTKFLYGFGKNEIDLSWANYRDGLREYDDNRTTPVGFYNGQTVFTKNAKNYQSRLARSPFGCFDMTGNVRQWTSDSEDGSKVTKGGSYNSPPSELLVSARSLFDPQSCQDDTGFRVAIDL